MSGVRTSDARAYGAMLFSAAIGDIVFPGFLIFLPLLAFQLHANGLEIGIVGGAANAMYGFMPYIMGRFSDRIGSRYSFIIGAFAILTIVALLDSLYPSPLNLIFFRIVEGIAWAMLYPALQAGLAEINSRDPRKSLAAYNMVWSGSFAIGPLVIGAIVFLTSIQYTFLVISGLLFLVLLVNLWALRNRSSTQTTRLNEDAFPTQNFSQQASNTTTNISALFYLVMTAVAAVAANIFFSFFPALASSIGFNSFLIGVVSFVYGAARFLTYLLLNSRNQILKRVLGGEGRKKKVYLTVFATCAACLPFVSAAHSLAVYLIACPIIAIGFGLNFMIAQSALVAEAPAAQRGVGAGLVESSVGAGGAVGPIAAGIVSGNSFTIPFVVPIFSYAIGILATNSKKPHSPAKGGGNRP
jgi:MFS family permease